MSNFDSALAQVQTKMAAWRKWRSVWNALNYGLGGSSAALSGDVCRDVALGETARPNRHSGRCVPRRPVRGMTKVVFDEAALYLQRRAMINDRIYRGCRLRISR